MSDAAPETPDQSLNVLTGIPPPLQCPAASKEGEGADEADEVSVQAFVETLARIAQAVAARKAHKQQEHMEQ
jgi:hypothetical protein